MTSFTQFVLYPILNSFQNFPQRHAFCIDHQFFTYHNLAENVSGIRNLLKDISSSYIGLVSNDDIETYAAIIALWLEGKSYIPLHPEWPLDRCENIVRQVEITTILDSSEKTRYLHNHIIRTKNIKSESIDFKFNETCLDDKAAYLLFTSGSTGIPKGVLISRENLGAFVNAFWKMGYSITENDRFLQCFDLTFDLSVMSYLIPLLKGACAYTIPLHEIKYTYIYDLIEEEELTFMLTVPSTLRYLRPYFNEIEAPSMRYCLFCGEALPEDLTREWASCIPNAEIDNVYGPTENTIFCTRYRFLRQQTNATKNGILSIGKPLSNTDMKIILEDGSESCHGAEGELCLSGKQLSSGYWRNDLKNKESFFIDQFGKKWYRTGDICYIDNHENYIYIGRIDFQIKIQGFRIEIGEIEHHVRTFLNGINVAVIALKNKNENSELALFIEHTPFDTQNLITYIRSKMPTYMIPASIFFIPIFPLNSNGKTDRNQLLTSLK